MKPKELYKIINEEISGFDFLSMDDTQNEEIRNKILKSKEFQTNLIIDIINDPYNKDKFKKISTTFINNNTDMYHDTEEIDVEVDLTYSFNEKDYDLIFFVSGEKNDDGKINFNDFDLRIFSKLGEKIDFSWVEKNQKLYKTLIQRIILPFLK